MFLPPSLTFFLSLLPRVQKQDYPERYKKLTEAPIERKELTDKLRKISQEIEEWEGRKVELVVRRILERPPSAPKSGSTRRKRGRGSGAPQRGRSSGAPQRGRGSKTPQRGRGSGAPQRGRGKSSVQPGRGSSSSNRGSGPAKRGRGTVPVQRGRGRGGRPQRGASHLPSMGRGWPGERGYDRYLLQENEGMGYLPSDTHYDGLLSRRDRFPDSGLDWRAPRFRFEEDEERWIEPTLSQRRSRPGLPRPYEQERIPFPGELPPSNPYQQPRRFPSQTSPPPDYKPFGSDWQMESRWSTHSGPLMDDPWQRRTDTLGSSSHRFHDNPFPEKLPFETFSNEPRLNDPGPSRSYSSRREEVNQ